MKSLEALFLVLVTLSALALTPRAGANNAGAVVLVNSQSPRYLDFTHFLQPYLGNFGVPYTVLDIASNPVGTSLTNYALIIVGHASLDTNQAYLTAAVQSNLSLAVSNGVGLVSFDNVLSSNTTALYQFEQDIFGLIYTNPVTAGSVVFPPTQSGSAMHYITSLHLTNETLALSNANHPTTMTVAGLGLPTNDTAVATCGGAPFVLVTTYGQGRAVQWTGYDWMSSTIQGPVNGLDDLVWRGFVWAARKPFVMRGLPNFATMRVDDVTGDYDSGGGAPPPFWWVHEMTNAGFKPFLALFIDDITAQQNNLHDGRLSDLSNLVASGSVTACVHSFSSTQTGATNFFYFNHATESQYPDAEMAQNYQRGAAFLANNGIPPSAVVIAHYSEMGTNSFNGLTNWGVQFVLIEVVPGTVEYAPPYAPWLVAGPYRLYETPGQGQVNLPMAYADWLMVPNHPELNGKFFDPYTEIRNVGGDGEWAPGAGDVPGAISRGSQMLKRGFDSMTLGNIFTHEFYIDKSDGPNDGNITTNDFATILQGITNAVAAYHPIFVTLDYGCQYVRAARTSQMTSADCDPVTGQITANFTGYTDIPITAYYYTGQDSEITNVAATVPVLSGPTNVTLRAGKPVLLVAADSKSRSYGATNPALTYTITGFMGTDTVAVVSGIPTLSTAAETDSDVGEYPIAISGGNLAATNYVFAFTNGLLTVTPATLLVSADNMSRPYGSTNPVLTYTLSGYLGTDTVSVVSGAPEISTSADIASPVGSYPITVTNGTLSAMDYNFALAGATLSVTATPPVILSLTGAGTTNVVITWAALSNATYRVRYLSDIGASNWQDLTPDVTATNVTASAVDNPVGVSQRFYQVSVP